MAALAIISDVEAGLGRSLTTAEIPRANALLALASAHVESGDVTGYRFAPGAYTVGRKVRDGKVKLPAKVATVAAVRAVDQSNGAVTVLALTTNYTTRGRIITLAMRMPPMALGETISSAPALRSLASFSSSIRRATMRRSGLSARAVRTTNTLSLSSDSTVMSPRARSIPPRAR